MINKYLFPVLVVVLGMSIFIAPRFLENKETNQIKKEPVYENKVSDRSTTVSITDEFSKKYKRPSGDFIIETQIDTGLFAKGSVRFKDEFGGAIWFGAKTANGWELAADGQGPMSCEIAEKYNFPNDLVPTCLDSENDNALVNR